MEQITVEQLAALCLQEIKKGNGNRKIVISDDNEGNGFHGLFFGFTQIKKSEVDAFYIYDSQEEDYKKVIVLG